MISPRRPTPERKNHSTLKPGVEKNNHFGEDNGHDDDSQKVNCQWTRDRRIVVLCCIQSISLLRFL